MKYLGLLFALLLSSAAQAQQVPHPAPMSLPTNNTALKAINGSINLRAARLGFTTAGDGGYAEYNWSASNCTAADDGAQVQPSVTGCWIADLTGMRPTPKIWGAVGNGVATDTAFVAAAIAWAAGKTLYSGPYVYKTGPLTISSGIKLVCERSRTTGGFVPSAINQTTLTITAEHVEIDGCLFNSGAPGTNTAGAAISLSGSSSYIHNNFITGAFIGVDLAGVVNQVAHNSIINFPNNGIGVRVGFATTGSSTVEPQVHHNWISGPPGGLGNYAIAVYDAGGMQYHDNTIGLTKSKITPGANQGVIWGFFKGEVGDSANGNGLEIDATSASASIRGNYFFDIWSASNTQANVYIHNTAGAFVQGIHFIGLRSYNSAQDGVAIGNNVSDVTIDNSSICGNSGSAANGYNGITIAGATSTGAIRNNTIGNTCDGLSGSQGTGIAFLTPVQRWIITGNDFSAAVGTGGGIGFSSPPITTICKDNRGAKWVQAYCGDGSVSIGPGEDIILPAGSGILSISNNSNGHTALVNLGGGSIILVSSGPSWILSGSPPSGTIGLFWDGTNYGIRSNLVSTVPITANFSRSRDIN